MSVLGPLIACTPRSRCVAAQTATQVEHQAWPNESYTLLFDHASRTRLGSVYLGNVVEGIAQVVFLNGKYALLQALAVSALLESRLHELLFDAVSCGFDELLGVDAGVLPETGLAIQISLRS